MVPQSSYLIIILILAALIWQLAGSELKGAQCPVLLQAFSGVKASAHDADKGGEHENSDVVEQILELFPSRLLNDEAKSELRRRGLIQELTHWMRTHSLWDGFNDTDDLLFWRAHQWQGSHADTWYGVPNTTHPMWWGQPSRIDGSPLLLGCEVDRWFNVTHYETLWNPGIVSWPSDEKWISGGAYLNHFSNDEFFVGQGWSTHWADGHQLVGVNLSKALPFVPYSARDEAARGMQFVGYNMTGPSWRERRAGVYLRGPGYAIDFCSIWDLDETGNAKLVFTTVYREVQLPEDLSDIVKHEILKQNIGLVAVAHTEQSVMQVLQYAWFCFKGWLVTFSLPIALCFLCSCWSSPQAGKPRLDALVGYRAFLMLTVFLYHAGMIFYSDTGGFFILSGLVLSLSRRSEPGMLKAPFEDVLEVGRWTALRLLRIVLPYWLAIAVGMSITMAPNEAYPWSKPLWSLWAMGVSCVTFPVKQPANAFLIQYKTGCFWFPQTLACFCILFPLFERILFGSGCSVKRGRVATIAAFCCIVKICILIFLYLKSDSFDEWSWYKTQLFGLQDAVSVYTNPLFRWPEFLLGTCLPHLPLSQSKVRAEISETTAWAAPFVDVAALALLVLLLSPKSKTISTLLNNNAQFPLHCILLWGLCFENGSRASKLLTSQVFLFLGSISYSFYLQQGVVLAQMDVLTWGSSRYENVMQWEAAYCFRVLCGFMALLATAWAATEFSEVWPNKVLQRLKA